MRRFILSLLVAALAAAVLVTALPAAYVGVDAPSRLNFGRLPVNSGSTTASLTIKNGTEGTIYYWGQSGLDTTFTTGNNGCYTVTAGSTCVITFYFTPTAVQKDTQTVLLYWTQVQGSSSWHWRTETLFVGTGFQPKH